MSAPKRRFQVLGRIPPKNNVFTYVLSAFHEKLFILDNFQISSSQEAEVGLKHLA